MDWILGTLGFVAGFFLWSNVFGSLFGTLPVQKEHVRRGDIKEINWLEILMPILVAAIVLSVAYIFWKSLFYGTLVGGVLMLLNISKLRTEAEQNFSEKHARDRI